jgi:hypothetical protein
VEVNLEAGLPEVVKLTVGSWTHYQKLDYEHLSFKCRNCQEHGHFQRNFPKLQTSRTEDVEGWKKVRRGKNLQSIKNRDKMPQDPPKEGNPKNTSQDSPKTQENPAIAIDEGEINNQEFQCAPVQELKALNRVRKTLIWIQILRPRQRRKRTLKQAVHKAHLTSPDEE